MDPRGGAVKIRMCTRHSYSFKVLCRRASRARSASRVLEKLGRTGNMRLLHVGQARLKDVVR